MTHGLETTAGARTGLSVTIRALTKRFGERTVISDLALRVPHGQFLAVVGRSGCGKSTLLRLIAGLDTPSAGSVRFDEGETVTSATNLRVMFQEPRLLPWARVRANVEVGLAEATDRLERRDRALTALAQVGLADRADQWPSALSGGQKQRVALARALVSEPRLLALDEPLGALDALTRIEMQDLIERVYLAQGFTAILVTHDVREALVLADRVVMIEHGRIALDMAVPFARPRQRSAAELAAIEDEILSRLLRPTQTAA